MFELGKDLSRYIARGAAGSPRDPEVLELLPSAVLMEQAGREARHAESGVQWRDVARLWREHARRTGDRNSSRQALKAAERAVALTGRGRTDAIMTCGLVLLTRWDLFGEEPALREAQVLGRTLFEMGDGLLATQVLIRQAARGDDAAAQRTAVDALHQELAQALAKGAGGDPWRRGDVIEARLEYAAAVGELGIRLKAPELLDRAGREVRALIAATDGDRQPISRARALATCGASLAVLGEMAGRRERIEEAIDMLEAAMEAFGPDHSAMDAATILMAQASALHRLSDLSGGGMLRTAGSLALKARRLAPAETRLNARIEVTANRLRISQAVQTRATQALRSMEANLKSALAHAGARCDPAAWAVDQLALAGVYDALTTLGEGPDRRQAAAMARSLAMETLRETGVAA